jgi:general L-amino acid transport system permease protein
MSSLTEVLPPLSERSNVLGWIRKNLFNSWGNSILTILASLLIFWAVRGLLVWIFTVAEWRVIAANLRLILLGQYPIAEVWRIWIIVYLLAFLTGNSFSIWGRSAWRIGLFLAAIPVVLALLPFGMQQRLWLVGLAGIGVLGWFLARGGGPALRRSVIIGWLLWLPILFFLLRGYTPSEGWMPIVTTNLWGGLLLTLLLTIVGIVFSFPLGVLLALGRRSELPIVRWFSVGYIELVRGVPLITILFMAQLMLPLFLPAGFTIDRVLRAMVGITLFSAAYLAENVRGGLQAISKGQFEAANALGLSGFQTMYYIILPQALRLIIPILVGQFIALFKDTALVSIVGLLDIVGIARTVLAQPEFLGLQREVYAFISLLYWVLSYAMSYVSQRLEVSLGIGER